MRSPTVLSSIGTVLAIIEHAIFFSLMHGTKVAPYRYMDEPLKRKEMLEMITAYYKSIGREKTPPIKDYSTQELRGVVKMFNLKK